ncbi:MAG: CotH kinase family protein, partial [Saprospiraceae bacterium]
MFRSCFLLSLFSLLAGFVFSQNLFPEKGPVYRDDVVPRIDIIIPADSLKFILADGNEESTYDFHASFSFDNGTIRDTFQNIGFALRGNTSRYSKKKSFRVSLNSYFPGRKWYGIEKLDLNGEHNDPTVSRSKICWDLLHDIGVPAPRCNHVKLYINGEYFGLYANVEEIDEEFAKTHFGNNDGNLYKCLYPADLTYHGIDPNMYKFTSGDRRAYDLRTNKETDDYSDLAHFIDVLNNTQTADMPCALESVFNVDTYLKAIAFDMLSGNWDGPLYNKNNFFLYHNEATGLFEYIPFDLDNTFGIDWFGVNWAERNIYTWCHPSEPRPLYTNIMKVPSYRDRLSYYLNYIIQEVYKESILFPKIDALKSLISSSVANDDYYTKDYGFSLNDFSKGFSQSLPYNHTPVGIKEYIASRRSSVINQLQLNDISPVIFDNTKIHPFAKGEYAFNAIVDDDQGLDRVEVNIQMDVSQQGVNSQMFDDGLHHDGEAEDGIYGLLINGGDTCSVLHYRIKATDVNGHESYKPVCGTNQLEVCNSSVTLAINEIMADNKSTVTDEYGEYEDWVEIYNYGSASIYLGDRYLSDKPDNPVKWRFPAISILPGGYLLIWADEDGSQGELHANFKLSAGGEFVGIYDDDSNGNALIDGLDFGQQGPDEAYGRLPDGTGSFQILFPTPGSMNQSLDATRDFQNQMHFQIYPNPAHDVVYFQSDEHATIHQNIIMVNIFGRVMMEKARQSKMQFDISGLPVGIYA